LPTADFIHNLKSVAECLFSISLQKRQAALKNKESQLLLQIEQIQKECLIHLAERQAEVSWK
jgi:hypothetical protein